MKVLAFFIYKTFLYELNYISLTHQTKRNIVMIHATRNINDFLSSHYAICGLNSTGANSGCTSIKDFTERFNRGERICSKCAKRLGLVANTGGNVKIKDNSAKIENVKNRIKAAKKYLQKCIEVDIDVRINVAKYRLEVEESKLEKLLK